MRKIKFKILCMMLFLLLFNFTVNANTYNDDNNEQVEVTSIGNSDLDNSKWRVVNYQNNIPYLTKSIDYSSNMNLINYLKKGDIVFEEFWSSGDNSVLGHSALVVDVYYDTTFNQEYVLLIESVDSDGDHGVILSALTPERFDTVSSKVVRVVDATQTQIDNAISFALAQYGKKYDLNTLAYPSVSTDSENWYCSELIYAAYYNQGIDLKSNEHLSRIIAPNEFLNSDLTKYVLGYDLTTEVVSYGTYHEISCNGDSIMENHNYIQYNSCDHKCKVCNNIINVNAHIYTSSYEMIDENNHIAYCRCGSSNVATHSYVNTNGTLRCACGYTHIAVSHEIVSYEVATTGVSHYAVCRCGERTLEYCKGLDTGLGFSVCPKCNQQLRNSGGIILTSLSYNKKEEDETA